MKDVYGSVRAGGMDVHYKFSTVTMRGEQPDFVGPPASCSPYKQPTVFVDGGESFRQRADA